MVSMFFNPEVDKTFIIELFLAQERMTIKDASQHYGITYGVISSLWVRRTYKKITRGIRVNRPEKRGAKRRIVASDKVILMRRMRSDGLSFEEIGRKMVCSRQNVQAALKYNEGR